MLMIFSVEVEMMSNLTVTAAAKQKKLFKIVTM